MSVTSVTVATSPALAKALRWAWVTVFVLALISRFVALGSRPLAPDEASRALGSLDAVRGEDWLSDSDAPLLLVGNALLFSLFSAGETMARLLPALSGVVVVMLPYLWRRVVGEVGAIAGASLLLISPLALLSARRLSPVGPGVAAAGLLLTLLMLEVKELHVIRWPGGLAALALGLGLVSGPAFYDLLVPGLLVWLVSGRNQLARVSRWRWSWGAALVLGTLISTALGFRWSGWAGIFEGGAAWITSWAGPRDGAVNVGMLLLYEPVLLALTVSGIVMVLLRRGRGSERFWQVMVWTMAVALLVIARPDNAPERLVAILLPLALLGSYGVTHLVRGVKGVAVKWTGLHMLVSFVLWLPAVLVLTQHARGLAYVDQLWFVIAGIVVFFALQVLLVFIFGLVVVPSLLWRSALAGFIAVLTLLQLSFATGLGYVRSNSPVEPAVVTVGSRDLQHLQAMMADLAVLRREREDAVPIVIVDRDESLTSVVRWTLRGFDELAVLTAWPEATDALVITPEAVTLEQPPEADNWRGMRFVALTTYDAPAPACETLLPPACAQLLKWYFYRITPYEARSQAIVLWQVREPL